jgi:YHS domain-containing protein
MEALLYFAVWAAFIFLMMRFGCGAHVMGHGHHGPMKNGREDRSAPDSLRWVPPKEDMDPVCGKTVRPENAKPSVHDGYVYYFCSRECREAFEAAPHLYVGPEAEASGKKLEHSHV